MVFVDTWAWLALSYQRDPYHTLAQVQHKEFRRDGRRYLTTNLVLSETISSLYRVVPAAQAEPFIERLLEAFRTGTDEIVHVGPELFAEAWSLRKRFRDKPDISFVDLTSMVCMREYGLEDVFTGDGHFLKVNLGFRLHP